MHSDKDINFIFHKPDFVFRNNSEDVVSFQDPASGVLIYFTQNNNTLFSLGRSPFGGFVLPMEISSDYNLNNLLDQIETYADTHKITSIQIRCCPVIYQSAFMDNVSLALQKNGYSVMYHDITQIITVSPTDPHFNTHRKRRLRSCLAEGFTFQLLNKTKLPEAYKLIVESRAHKDYPVTMSLNDLATMFELFPKEYILMGVYDRKQLIATAVVIQVSPTILYCFYIGDALSYRKYSPVTLLMANIYRYSQSTGAGIIDLGISTDCGVLNAGLYEFKKSLGAIDSMKYTFIKKRE